MPRCEDAERVSENLESRRCEDAKLRRGFQKIWRAEDAKMRRCEDAMLRQPPQYLPIQCHEDAKMQRCDDARPGQCPLSATCLFLHPPAAATDFAQVGQLSDHEAASSISMAK